MKRGNVDTLAGKLILSDLQLRGVARTNHYAAALFSELTRQRKPKSARPASDDHNFPGDGFTARTSARLPCQLRRARHSRGPGSYALSRLQHHLDAVVFLRRENRVHLRPFFELRAVGDDVRRIDLAVLDAIQQRTQVALHVGLAHFES
jgi:hypothetical protein